MVRRKVSRNLNDEGDWINYGGNVYQFNVAFGEVALKLTSTFKEYPNKPVIDRESGLTSEALSSLDRNEGKHRCSGSSHRPCIDHGSSTTHLHTGTCVLKRTSKSTYVKGSRSET